MMGLECRYGTPAADQILTNNRYTVGYSYYFRQAKWALEVVSKVEFGTGERMDDFRPDYRVPELFRVDLEDYAGRGYDRGHLIPSVSHHGEWGDNSETFLLSNICPQEAGFNRGIWRRLEVWVDNMSQYGEVYVISGPIFDFDSGVGRKAGLPVPDSFFKSVLVEGERGGLKMWSFIFKNERSDTGLKAGQVSCRQVERMAGIELWDALKGEKIDKEKNRIREKLEY